MTKKTNSVKRFSLSFPHPEDPPSERDTQNFNYLGTPAMLPGLNEVCVYTLDGDNKIVDMDFYIGEINDAWSELVSKYLLNDLAYPQKIKIKTTVSNAVRSNEIVELSQETDIFEIFNSNFSSFEDWSSGYENLTALQNITANLAIAAMVEVVDEKEIIFYGRCGTIIVSLV